MTSVVVSTTDRTLKGTNFKICQSSGKLTTTVKYVSSAVVARRVRHSPSTRDNRRFLLHVVHKPQWKSGNSLLDQLG